MSRKKIRIHINFKPVLDFLMKNRMMCTIFLVDKKLPAHIISIDEILGRPYNIKSPNTFEPDLGEYYDVSHIIDWLFIRRYIIEENEELLLNSFINPLYKNRSILFFCLNYCTINNKSHKIKYVE